jgi:toxin YoeB
VRVHFSPLAWSDYRRWIDADRAVLDRLNRLIDESCRTPFAGFGKPVPLKGAFAGFWSRRITGEHRLIYCVEIQAGRDQRVEIASCRYHYGR